jgi:hypothetical protein
MISDVRVSFTDQTQSDMLRKVYPIGPWMLAGFAGSVRIGMTLIDNLQCSLSATVPQNPPKGYNFVFNPDVVAEDWAPRAAEIFARMPAEEQAQGSQILLVGVSTPPPENPLPPNAQKLPYVHMIKFSWPHFEPQLAEERWTAQHIGSGANIEGFVAAIRGLFQLENGTLNSEMAPGGWGTLLGHSVGRLVRENPVDGIGAHANIDTCHLGSMYRGNNNERIFPPDGTVINFEMPPIAESYEQFLAMCEKRGKAATAAVG